MNKRRLRVLASITVLTCTAAAFCYYITTHPTLINQLRSMNPWLLAVLLALYGVLTLSLVFIFQSTLRIIYIRMPFTENLLLTSYSSLINFFGPLQSGPGVRMVYLKQKYAVPIKSYLFATFLYYGFFALMSGLFLTIGVLRWWQTALIVGVIAAGSSVLIIRQKRKAELSKLKVQGIISLAVATLFQVLIVAVIYFVELRAVDAHVSFMQAITYTGAANFALFVSLTPGAIGFRESFLLFSQHLHHISSTHVLTASLLDRAVNVTFLVILFCVTLVLHARERLHIKSSKITS